MVFSSLFFLYIFLPACLALYFVRRNVRWRNGILIAFSLVFYAWGEPIYVFLMLATVLVNWALTLKIESAKLAGIPPKRTKRGRISKAEAAERKAIADTAARKAKTLLICAIAIDLGLLGIFKYAVFITETLNAAISAATNANLHEALPVPDIALPIGISFYTFQVMSYVIDVYRGDTPAQRSFPKLLTYVSMFPQLVAGPIVRYEHIAERLETRTTDLHEVGRGIERFLVGLAKKAVLANICGNVADTLLDANSLGQLSMLGAWLGIAMFAFQIYFDFSAYSDMAIGMGRIFGFQYRENFNYPYIASTASEFWRRWHISLGAFFRDYVYIPLGGNRIPPGGNRAKPYRNLLIVWALTGLWHGASWNFVIWGLYWFAFIALERHWLRQRIARWPAALPHIYTTLVFLFGWVIFYFTDIRDAAACIARMFGAGALTDTGAGLLLRNNLFLIVAAALVCLPLGRAVSRLYRIVEHRGGPPAKYFFAVRCIWLAALLFLSTIMLVGNSYNPFIYFRF
jgi:alginate O-acetyltransferase complex protein AlgI